MTKSASGKKNKVSSQKNENSKKKETRVTIRYDVGFSNNLFIRGHGAGLSWDRGVLLKNIGPDEWIWEASNPFGDCEFKVLINDRLYEAGENHHLHDGVWLQYTPKF
ncbi:MAG: hypothetical protein JSS60_08590 [Verrucomicrobia bacterium]|nr:hypothetical protein [Verrucomicrobiota bacterium]